MNTVNGLEKKTTSNFSKNLKVFILKHFRLFLMLNYNLIFILIPIIFYPLIPVIMNYPPGFIEASRDLSISYGTKQIISLGIIMLLGNILLFKYFNGINEWNEALKANDFAKIKVIRQKCLKLPYYIYILMVVFITGSLAVILFTFTIINLNLIYIRVLLLVSTFISLSSLAAFLLANKMSKLILLETYIDQDMEGFRIGLRGKIFLQLIPLFMAALLLISMIGYSRLIEEKGDLYYELSNSMLEDKFFNNYNITSLGQVKEILSSIQLKDTNYSTFIISPDNSTTTSNGSPLSTVLNYYINKLKPSYNGRVYDVTCETQGVIKKITLNGRDWVIGIKFEVASQKSVGFFLISFISLLIINILILYYISKSLVDDISIVAKGLTEIAESEEVNLDKKIPLTSNDEIGDLIVAFHKIQELEKSNIKSLQEKQAVILEKERLASLGQMIGGIAHNLNTPIMSISGVVEKLKDLVKEYSESIGDNNVLDEDHREIAADMLSNIEKITPHCAYMSNIINTVKIQAVNLNESTSENFYFDELIKIIKVSINHKEKICNCKVNLRIDFEENIKIQGEVNNLIQVINNLILNAMESYGEKGGVIDFNVTRNTEKINFIIQDFGAGMPKDIQEKIFKQMITTKGKNGTGIGLYMSYSTIKGKFGGDIWFESMGGKGTTFYISIPIIV